MPCTCCNTIHTRCLQCTADALLVKGAPMFDPADHQDRPETWWSDLYALVHLWAACLWALVTRKHYTLEDE